MEVEVTNWTFGSHGTYHIFGTECTVSGCGCNGSNHEDYLTDKYFDYVFINSATRSTEDTAYCAITGESAVGQPYSFYNDTTLNPKFDMDAYLDEYYTNGASDTNADEIFNSKSDMTGLQKLVDKWFLEKPYLNE